MRTTDPYPSLRRKNKMGLTQVLGMVGISCFLYAIHYVAYIVKSGKSLVSDRGKSKQTLENTEGSNQK